MLLPLLACAFVSTPLTPEVETALPLPRDLVRSQSSCAGLPRTQQYTCLVTGHTPWGRALVVEQATARMAGWRETSWDRVPGRTQLSWTRGAEHVSLAVHDGNPGSQVSVSYVWADGLASTPRPMPPAPLPPGDLPGALAWLVLPEGTRVVGVGGEAPRHVVNLEVFGDPDAFLDALTASPGAQETLRARSEHTRALSLRYGELELSVVVAADAADPHGAWLRTWPALW